MATEFRGAANQYGQGWSARPEDNSRIKEGQQEDSSRTREDKRSTRPATEPGHRVQGCGQSVWPGQVGVARGQQQDKRRTTAAQEEDKTRPQSSGAWPVSVASSFGEQEEDKARTQSRATEPSHRVQGHGQ